MASGAALGFICGGIPGALIVRFFSWLMKMMEGGCLQVQCAYVANLLL